MAFRFPKNTERVAVIGRTGSGKTQKGAWLLSESDFTRQPWIIIDYKYDSLLNEIDGIEEIGLGGKLPKHPGLYIVHPLPAQDDLVDDLFWKIWAKEHTGVFIDEAFMTPNYRKYGAYNALLTQGRSKQIPVISLTQRPAWISPFVFSESDFFSVFHLNTRSDQRKVEEFVPGSLDVTLPEYHSYWYDVKKNRRFLMQPVPDRDMILQNFEARLRQMHGKSRIKRRFL